MIIRILKLILVIMMPCLLKTSAFAQPSEKNGSPWGMVASYTGDAVGNLKGGISQGGGYLGYAVLGVSYDGKENGRWRNGGFRLTGGWTHGCTPTESFVGDWQFVDNLEAGNHLFLQECYLSQQWKNLEVTLGMQDFCMHYCFLPSANLYMNSSFGISSVLTCNYQLSIYPLFALGCNLRWQISPSFGLQAAVFDTPLDWEENPYNLNWCFQREKGYNLVLEGTYASSPENGTLLKMAFITRTDDGAVGLQALAEQCLAESERHSLHLFLMGAIHLSENCNHPLQFAAGGNFRGLCTKSGKDVLGLAITDASIRSAGSLQHETVLELTWMLPWNDHVYIQPDLQYLIHPFGECERKSNALFAALRFGVEW